MSAYSSSIVRVARSPPAVVGWLWMLLLLLLVGGDMLVLAVAACPGPLGIGRDEGGGRERERGGRDDRGSDRGWRSPSVVSASVEERHQKRGECEGERASERVSE